MTGRPARQTPKPCGDREIAELLRSRGLRATRARCLILALLADSDEHPNAEMVVQQLHERGHDLALATAYQNLSTLAASGLLDRFVGLDGIAHFDGNLEPHHHVVCTSCGRTVDCMVSDKVEGLEPVDIHAGAGLGGWSVHDRRLEFRALCPDCSG
jgi:Fe2+ or Zn2+ uptake regulation protein